MQNKREARTRRRDRSLARDFWIDVLFWLTMTALLIFIVALAWFY